jgi:hypothetical protein
MVTLCESLCAAPTVAGSLLAELKTHSKFHGCIVGHPETMPTSAHQSGETGRCEEIGDMIPIHLEEQSFAAIGIRKSL